MQGLDRPAGLDEAGGEPIEQFGVRRPLAPRAEVVAGGDEPGAEVVLPDSVDHHPRSERVLRRGNPAGQLQASTAGGLQWGVALAGEDLQEAARGDPAEIEAIPADMDAQVSG